MSDYYNNGVLDRIGEIGKYSHEFFKKFTVPSIINQTNQNFLWLILADPNTPYHYLDKLLKVIEYKPNILLHFIPDVVTPKVIDLFPIIQKFIQEFACVRYIDKLITTGLDNDDALSVCYVDKVQNFVKNHPKKDCRYLIDVPISYYVSPNLDKIHIHEIQSGVHASTAATMVELVCNDKGKKSFITVYAHMHGGLRPLVEEVCYVPASNLHTVHAMNSSDRNWENYPQEEDGWQEKFNSFFPFL